MSRDERKTAIVSAMRDSKFSMLNASEIAAAADMAESTVRRYLPELLKDRRIRHTSYTGIYAVNGGS